GITMLVLAVPFIAQWKRAMAGFAICALLLFGLRSRAMLRRCVWLLASFVLFTLLLSTPILSYVGQAVANNTALSRLIPADVQANEIGRASCRESVLISWVVIAVKKNTGML